ncbi:MAG TPA: response regulator [Myxococcaceae bacterium]|nr:response regulator [Myxococcaceae bacterium]
MPRPRLLVVDDNLELLSLLTHLFEDAGYDVVSASKAKQALDVARGNAPALAVLDVLLPDLMGYHLADQLRKEFPQLPVIFVTGVFKGGKHGLEAKQKHGAVAWFEKPFEARKLLEAVARHVPATPPSSSGGTEEFEVELDIDIEEEEQPDTMELTGKIKVTDDGEVSAELRGADLRAKPMQRYPDTLVRTRPAGSEPPPAPTKALRRGELKDNLPSLITAFFQTRETGELGVQRGQVKKVVYFQEGMPVFALSNLLSDRLGQFLVRTGKIRPEQLADVALMAQQTKRRTGDILVERGLLRDTERVYYVGQQVKSIIYSLFAWEEGSYVMSFGGKALGETLKLDVNPANLIVRGVKKLYKSERVKRILALEDRLVPSRQPVYPQSDIELERWETDLLAHADGSRTVAELIAFARRPEPVVQLTLASLLAVQALEKPA